MKVLVRDWGTADYVSIWRAMQAFTAARGEADNDELWLVQHLPVFTLGRAAKREHLIAPGDIAVVETDRGGQVTYHGPGQLVAYTLIDVRRLGIGPRELVRRIEQAMIELLEQCGIAGERRSGAPGVYVAGSKIAALGLRIRKGCSYHGVALNVGMDLQPFQRINPCGYAGLRVTQVSAHGGPGDCGRIADAVALSLCHCLYPETPVDVHFSHASVTALSEAPTMVTS